MHKFLLRLIVCLMISVPVWAQTITGKVTDDKGEPIAGASIVVKGSSRGTTTSFDGRYSIEASQQSTLVFSFIGFVTRESQVGNSSVLDIMLAEDNLQLGEVVVTALGIQKESRQIGYSVQKVESKDITKVAPPNMAQGLMGKVAGLNISVPNGIEGGSQRIVIRGNNSLLGNNQPLLVIDGVQVQENSIGVDSKSGTQSNDLGALKDWGSYLNFINSEDVQEVNVLKGPTAAALYGARGANGVIISQHVGPKLIVIRICRMSTGMEVLLDCGPLINHFQRMRMAIPDIRQKRRGRGGIFRINLLVMVRCPVG